MKNCIIIIITFTMLLMLIAYFYPEEEKVREDFLNRATVSRILYKGEVEDYIVTYWFAGEQYHFFLRQLPPSEQLIILERRKSPNEKESAYIKA